VGQKSKLLILSEYVNKTEDWRSTHPCIPLWWLSCLYPTSAGWQVTLCDPMWHASSRSGEALVADGYSLFYVCTYLFIIYVVVEGEVGATAAGVQVGQPGVESTRFPDSGVGQCSTSRRVAASDRRDHPGRRGRGTAEYRRQGHCGRRARCQVVVSQASFSDRNDTTVMPVYIRRQ